MVNGRWRVGWYPFSIDSDLRASCFCFEKLDIAFMGIHLLHNESHTHDLLPKDSLRGEH